MVKCYTFGVSVVLVPCNCRLRLSWIIALLVHSPFCVSHASSSLSFVASDFRTRIAGHKQLLSAAL